MLRADEVIEQAVHFRLCEGVRMPAHEGGAARTGAGVRKPPIEMLWGGGEDIASIVADVN